MNDFKAMAEEMKKYMPQVSFNKNGYEIRTQVLEMAQTQEWQDYKAKMGEYGTEVTKEDNEVVTKVTMPTAPGVEKILETAEKFYDFINKK